jgi:hypothetical protein
LLRLRAWMDKNIQKRKARTRRGIKALNGDRGIGLWVDYDLLRKHQGCPDPNLILLGQTSAASNRYLELADMALGNNKPKKKSKSASVK